MPMPRPNAQKIRSLREQHGWSRKTFVDRMASADITACVTEKTVERIERGKQKSARGETLIIMAKVLGVTFREITLQEPADLKALCIGAGKADLPGGINIPPSKDEFVGRNVEQTRLRHLIEHHRLVTVAGPPGAGKTRLCREVARSLSKDLAVVWYVPLPFHGIALEQCVANALHLRGDAERDLRNVIIEALQDGPQLLVLDNSEHVWDQCRKFVDDILSKCPDLRIVVTTRIVLGIEGEHVYRIPMLTVPQMDVALSLENILLIDSVKLLTTRAEAHGQFRLTEKNALAISDLCRRLEGLPLAIELAAAQLRVMSVEQILQRFDKRLDLWCDTPISGGEEITRGLRHSIQISFDLIREHPSKGEKRERVFRRLSMFRGCTISAVTFVCAEEGETEDDLLDTLKALLDSSLLQADDVAGERRFQYLDTIREFAVIELSRACETAFYAERHALWYTELAELAAPKLLRDTQVHWLQRLDADADNFRSAIFWSTEQGRAKIALRLTGALWRGMEIKGFCRQGCDRLRMALGMPESNNFPRLQLKALSGLGTLSYRQGDLKTAEQCALKCMCVARELDDQSAIAFALNDMGNVAYMKGACEEALRQYLESLVLQRVTDNQRGIAVALFNTAKASQQLNRLEDVEERLEESLQMFESEGNIREAAFPLNALGILASFRGHYDAAQRFAERSYRLWKEVGDRRGMAESLRTIARARLGKKELDLTHTLLCQSSLLVAEIGDQRGIAECLELFAHLHAVKEMPLKAISLYAAANRLRIKVRLPLGPADSANQTLILKEAKSTVTSDEYKKAWALGLSMELELAFQEVGQTLTLRGGPGNSDSVISGSLA